jgi:hypothetical protein
MNCLRLSGNAGAGLVLTNESKLDSRPDSPGH